MRHDGKMLQNKCSAMLFGVAPAFAKRLSIQVLLICSSFDEEIRSETLDPTRELALV